MKLAQQYFPLPGVHGNLQDLLQSRASHKLRMKESYIQTSAFLQTSSAKLGHIVKVS